MSNSWAQLIRLLPSTDTIAGQILSIDGTNAVILDLERGTFIAQMGNVVYTVGDWVLIRDNIIISTLPVPEVGPDVNGARNMAIS